MGAISTSFTINASAAQSSLRSVKTHLTNIDKMVDKISGKSLTIDSAGAERMVGLMNTSLTTMQAITQNMSTLSQNMAANLAKQSASAQKVANAEAIATQKMQAKAQAAEETMAAQEAAVLAASTEEMVTARTMTARERIGSALKAERVSLLGVLTTERQITTEVDKQKNKGFSVTRSLIRAWATLSGIRGLWMATNKLLTIFNDSMLMTNKAATALRDTIGSLGSTGLDAGRVALDKYYEAANRARTSYTEFASTASKFMIVAPNAFGTDTKAIQFTETLSKSLQLAGASGEEVNSVLLQVSQGLSSGYLQGDELRALRENGGMAAIALANYLGTTVGGLKELGAQGVITADVLVAALEAAQEDIDASFGNLPKTISQQMAIAGNYIRKKLEPLSRRIQEWLNSDQFEEFATAAKNLWDAVALGLHLIVELALRVVIPAFTKIVNTLKWVARSSSVMATFLRSVFAAIGLSALLLGAKLFWLNTAFVRLKISAVAGWLAALWPIILVAGLIVLVINLIARLTGKFTSFADTASSAIYSVVYALVAIGLAIFNTVVTVVAIILIVARTIIQAAVALVTGIVAVVVAVIFKIVEYAARFIGWFVGILADGIEGMYEFGDSLGEAITRGVNKAIRALNWLIEKLNSIPGLDLDWNAISEMTYTPNADNGSAGSSLRATADKITSFANGTENKLDGILGSMEEFNTSLNSPDGPLGFVDDFSAWVTEHNKNNRPLDKADEIATKVTNKINEWSEGIGDASSEEFLFNGGSDSGSTDGGGGTGGGGSVSQIAEDTNDIKNLLERMRDLAERSAIAKFTNVNVNLDMTNNVGETDLDGVITYVNDKVAGAMNNSLAGVL